MKTKEFAEIFQSAICRTRVGVARPAPSLFYYPGLNSKAVHSLDNFKELTATLKENQAAILNEYQQYKLKHASDYITNSEHKLHKGDWQWNSYILKGKKQGTFASHCPITVEVLESLKSPKLMTNTPFSFAFFSTLGPQATIESHHGPCNLRLRCHFPLIVPDENEAKSEPETQQQMIPQVGMKIGNEIVRWEEGTPVIFDDCYEHSGIFLNYF